MDGPIGWSKASKVDGPKRHKVDGLKNETLRPSKVRGWPKRNERGRFSKVSGLLKTDESGRSKRDEIGLSQSTENEWSKLRLG